MCRSTEVPNVWPSSTRTFGLSSSATCEAFTSVRETWAHPALWVTRLAGLILFWEWHWEEQMVQAAPWAPALSCIPQSALSVIKLLCSPSVWLRHLISPPWGGDWEEVWDITICSNLDTREFSFICVIRKIARMDSSMDPLSLIFGCICRELFQLCTDVSRSSEYYDTINPCHTSIISSKVLASGQKHTHILFLILIWKLLCFY